LRKSDTYTAIEADHLLLERHLRGDEAAYEQLFLRYYEQVYRLLRSVLGGVGSAEDAAQEAFLELYRNPPRLEAGGRLTPWLCRVAFNRAYDMLRSERRARDRMERASSWSAPDESDAGLLRTEEQIRVRDALARLQERQVKLLLLRAEGFSYAEIAGVLGVAPGSVGTLLARAARALLKEYQGAEQLETSDHER
jgi:RNA polymerase sigma-70 factor (ECF subfamily)